MKDGPVLISLAVCALAVFTDYSDGHFIESTINASKLGALAYVSVMVRRNTAELKEMRRVLFKPPSTKDD